MTQIGYWSVLTFIRRAPEKCVNLGVGIICGAAQAIGIEIFTKDSINEAIRMKSASDLCRDELPIELTAEHDEIHGKIDPNTY